MNWRRYFSGFLFDTYGASASAMFLVCLVSGVVLSPFYDSADAYNSIARFLIFNPWAAYYRDIHFWSAQLFLVLSAIHLWGYMRPLHFKSLRQGVWIRLSFALPLMFYAMFSGFLLKGDNDSVHAAAIFRSLLSIIPWIGNTLAMSVLGDDGGLQLTYVHHIATATILLVIIIKEHAKKLWAGYRTFLLATLLILVIAFFLRAPLHDGINPLVKGPWYFLGVQELLHWMPVPASAWWLLLLFMGMLIYARYSSDYWLKRLRLALLGMSLLFILATTIGIFFRAEEWRWTYPGKGENASRYPVFRVASSGWKTAGAVLPDPTAPMESCLACHDNFTGFSLHHDPERIGCHVCHGGDKFSLHAGSAHRNMYLTPGNLSDSRSTCSSSSCHPDIIPRIEQSLMTSNSGLISVNRWVFGEAMHPDGLGHVAAVGNSAADSHLRNLCMACHLGRAKSIPGKLDESSRGGGCLACHLNYSSKAVADLAQYLSSRGKLQEMRQFEHPRVDLQVSNTHCFGCHSRSGRISTNYEGWHETLLHPDSASPMHRIVQGTRVFTPMPADVHHKAGLSCIDCHGAIDVMGDGRQHRHKEEAVYIACTDCHRKDWSSAKSWANLDYESRKILRIRGVDSTLLFANEQRSGRPVIGARLNAGVSAAFFLRGGGDARQLKAPAEACSQGKAHDNLHCSACHSGWASRCIGCHTDFDSDREGKDLLTGKKTAGSWYELMGDFLASPPTLGVVIEASGRKVVRPVVPGMIMTIGGSYESKRKETSATFHRLFALAEPHTTQAEGRSCVSCHNNPIALGYGGGELRYVHYGRQGRWVFLPEYADRPEDGLPADAWTGFLKSREGKYATRLNVRPFSVEEQQRILQVGACLTCHEGSSKVMRQGLNDFDALLKRTSGKCVLPAF